MCICLEEIRNKEFERRVGISLCLFQILLIVFQNIYLLKGADDIAEPQQLHASAPSSSGTACHPPPLPYSSGDCSGVYVLPSICFDMLNYHVAKLKFKMTTSVLKNYRNFGHNIQTSNRRNHSGPAVSIIAAYKHRLGLVRIRFWHEKIADHLVLDQDESTRST